MRRDRELEANVELTAAREWVERCRLDLTGAKLRLEAAEADVRDLEREVGQLSTAAGRYYPGNTYLSISGHEGHPLGCRSNPHVPCSYASQPDPPPAG